MSSAQRCSALLFDGVSAGGQSVELCLSGAELKVLKADGSVLEISWDQLDSVGHAGGRCQLHLRSGVLVLFDDKELLSVIRTQRESRLNTVGRSLSTMDRLPWKKMLVLFLLVGGSFVALLYYGFTNAYRLAPVGYDTYLGSQVSSRFLDGLDTCASPALDTFRMQAASVLHKNNDRFDHPVTILNVSDENAFALPGGRIYVFRGLLESSHSPDELIGVLAHEVAHSEKRHGVQQLFRNMGTTFIVSLVVGGMVEGFDMLEQAESLTEISTGLLMMRYSRTFEREADVEAARRLGRAGLPAAGLDSLLRRLQPETDRWDSLLSFLGTHPLAQERSQLLRKAQGNWTPTADPQILALRKNWERIKTSCPQPQDSLPLWRQMLP